MVASGYGSKDEKGEWNGMIREVLEEVGVTRILCLAAQKLCYGTSACGALKKTCDKNLCQT